MIQYSGPHERHNPEIWWFDPFLQFKHFLSEKDLNQDFLPSTNSYQASLF